MKNFKDVMDLFYSAYNLTPEKINGILETNAPDKIGAVELLAYCAKVKKQIRLAIYAVKKISEFENNNIGKFCISFYAENNQEEYTEMVSTLISETSSEKISREVVVILAQGYNSKKFNISQDDILTIIYLSALLSKHKVTDMINASLVKKLSNFDARNLKSPHQHVSKLLLGNIMVSK